MRAQEQAFLANITVNQAPTMERKSKRRRLTKTEENFILEEEVIGETNQSGLRITEEEDFTVI